MPLEFKLPQLAEGIDNADVAELHVQAGDTVEAGQIVMELETDKAVMELPCPHAGKITQLLVKKGDTVKVGQPILQIDAVDAAATNGSSAGATESTSSAKAESGKSESGAATKSEKEVIAAAAWRGRRQPACRCSSRAPAPATPS
ncbi:MAG: biotin/lipoyl-containing protein, partial [Planctomycetaceae bacterium]|nr:biotin/lipoyl-containing protein [Planctomycetaceae bacterium]